MNKTTIVLSAIIAVLLGYIVFFTGGNTEDKYAKQKHEIDSLTVQILKLQNQQEIQDALIQHREDSIELLSQKIELKDKKIKEIRKYYGDKIKTTSDFTPVQLDSFFTNRYK
jgi:hypothetical protein